MPARSHSRARCPRAALLSFIVLVACFSAPGVASAAAPVATADTDTSQSCSTQCGIRAFPRGSTDVLANDTGDGDLTVSGIDTAPAHGTASCSSLGACRYTATGGYLGADEFKYTLHDGNGVTTVGTVTVEVVAATAGTALIPEDDQVATLANQAVTLHVLDNDSGKAPLTVSGVTVNPSHGTVDCAANGDCAYTPTAGYIGTDGFRYKAKDADATEETADAHILVVRPGVHYTLGLDGNPSGGGSVVAPGGHAAWAARLGTDQADVALEELAALPLPTATGLLSGPHVLDDGTLKVAKGFEVTGSGSGAVNVAATGTSLRGDAISEGFPKPLPPIKQGSGGDGHVPILAGTKVFAFYHHSSPTSATGLDRRTGALCAGYPTNGIRVNASASNNNGPGVVVGTHLYTHLWPSGYYGSGYAQTAPLSLFCWDTKTNDPCGWVFMARKNTTGNLGGSAPVLVDGKIYMTGDTGKLHCFDDATGELCGTIDTGLADTAGGEYDAITHGTRVYVSRRGDKINCLDVATKAPCTGWDAPKAFAGKWNLINQYDANGKIIGVCDVAAGDADCVPDDNPAAPVHLATFVPSLEDTYSTTEESETGKRTFFGSLNRGGLGCWDWSTNAVCAGPRFGADGWVTTATDNSGLPSAYGTAWDGSCGVAVGDPGQVYTVDEEGNSPCTSLSTGTNKRTIDLRDQRCDGTVGDAKFVSVTLGDVNFGADNAELTSVVVTIRDATTNQVVATGNLIGGDHRLDLSSIDAQAHPRITLDANASGPSSNIAWEDAIPPRLRLTWKTDPKPVCFSTHSVVDCATPAGPKLGVTAKLTPGGEEKKVELNASNPDCSKPAAATTPAVPVAATSVPRSCIGARRFSIHVRYKNSRLSTIKVEINGKKQTRVKSVGGRPVFQVDLRKLAKSTVKVKVTIKTKSGKTLTGNRVYHPCTKKLPDRGFKF